MACLATVTGWVDVEELGCILPHEHVLTDLRPPDVTGRGEVDLVDVVAVMSPRIEEARAAGVTAIIECTPAGVGRNIAALRALSLATGFPIVASAGTYREAFMPAWVKDMDEAGLMAWLRQELVEGIDGTDVLGGLIKLAVSDEGITPAEERVLRAAGRVGAELGVTVASHTLSGRSAVREADILASVGLPAERFVWVHTQAEPDVAYHREVGQRGCYLEYDGIGNGDDGYYLAALERAFTWGLGERVLLSQDAGWYRPGEPRGGQQAPYDYLPKEFVPELRREGYPESVISLLIEENPKRAFAREPRPREEAAGTWARS